MKKVAELTVDEFREIVRDVVCEVLAEQQDEYEGELRPEFVAELDRRRNDDQGRLLSEDDSEFDIDRELLLVEVTGVKPTGQ